MNIERMIEQLKEFKFILVERNNDCKDCYWKDEYQRKYITTTKMIDILEEEK